MTQLRSGSSFTDHAAPELPPELWEYIASFLDMDDLYSVYAVNSVFLHCAMSLRYNTIHFDIPANIALWSSFWRPFPLQLEYILGQPITWPHVHIISIGVNAHNGPTLKSARLMSLAPILIWAILHSQSSYIESKTTVSVLAVTFLCMGLIASIAVFYASRCSVLLTHLFGHTRAILEIQRALRFPWLASRVPDSCLQLSSLHRVQEMQLTMDSPFVPDPLHPIYRILHLFRTSITTLSIGLSSSTKILATFNEHNLHLTSLTLSISDTGAPKCAEDVALFICSYRTTLQHLSLTLGHFGHPDNAGICAPFLHLANEEFPCLRSLRILIKSKQDALQACFPALGAFLASRTLLLLSLHADRGYTFLDHLILPSTFSVRHLEVNDQFRSRHQEQILSYIMQLRRPLYKFTVCPGLSSMHPLLNSLAIGIYDLVVLDLQFTDFIVSRLLLEVVSRISTLEELRLEVVWTRNPDWTKARIFPLNDIRSISICPFNSWFQPMLYPESTLKTLDIIRSPPKACKGTKVCRCSPQRIWGLMKLFKRSFPSLEKFASIGSLDAPSGEVVLCESCQVQMGYTEQTRTYVFL